MISKALEIENNDFEDTLQYLSAKSADCEYVITNDKSFYKADLKTISSSEFIEKYLQLLENFVNNFFYCIIRVKLYIIKKGKVKKPYL